MSQESETPRVDAVAHRRGGNHLKVNAAFARGLEREINKLKHWIREEGRHSGTCTYSILGEVCDTCRCHRKGSK